MKTHKDLEVWKKSVNLVTKIYDVTKSFPTEEIYGLTNQIRRAAVSVPSNIAEGAARNYNKEFIQFLHIALGSVAELDTQILIAVNLGYLEQEKYNDLLSHLDETGKMLKGLINYRKKLGTRD